MFSNQMCVIEFCFRFYLETALEIVKKHRLTSSRTSSLVFIGAGWLKPSSSSSNTVGDGEDEDDEDEEEEEDEELSLRRREKQQCKSFEPFLCRNRISVLPLPVRIL